MKPRNVAVVVFFDKKLNIVVQDRGKDSKIGEKYGFFGGKIERGEKPLETIKREIFEELGFIPQKLYYYGRIPFRIKEEAKWRGRLINQYVFLSPINRELKKAKIFEGKGMKKMKIDRVIEGKDFPIGSTKFLEKLKIKIGV